jgi:hypothetical protein
MGVLLIVNNSNFFHRIGLLKGAVNGPGKKLFIVIADNNNTGQRKVAGMGGDFLFVRFRLEHNLLFF